MPEFRPNRNTRPITRRSRGIGRQADEAPRATGRRTPTRRRTSTRKTSTRRPIARRRGTAVKGAQNQLKRFRMGSILAVAITGFLLLLFAPAESGYSQEADELSQTEIVAETEESEQEGMLAQTCTGGFTTSS